MATHTFNLENEEDRIDYRKHCKIDDYVSALYEIYDTIRNKRKYETISKKENDLIEKIFSIYSEFEIDPYREVP